MTPPPSGPIATAANVANVATVACPVCAKPVPWVEASRWRPFCSERCRMIDLGDWAAERHRIAGAPLEDSVPDAPAPPAPPATSAASAATPDGGEAVRPSAKAVPAVRPRRPASGG
jgi:uncharacterized protein